jgi:Spy/CpxP family protein refolding chaperone
MAETTTQAWDWHVELHDAAPSELDALRQNVAQLTSWLHAAHDSLRLSKERERDALQALRELDSAKPWERRRVRAKLRERHLL